MAIARRPLSFVGRPQGAPQRSASEPPPGDRHAGAERHARIKVQHVRVVHPDAAFRGRRANGPRRIRAVDAIHAGAEVQRADAERVHRVPSHDVHGQARVLAPHFRCGGPAWIDALVGYRGHTLPAALLTRDSDRVADGHAPALHPIQAAIPEADDDLAWSSASDRRRQPHASRLPRGRRKSSARWRSWVQQSAQHTR